MARKTVHLDSYPNLHDGPIQRIPLGSREWSGAFKPRSFLDRHADAVTWWLTIALVFFVLTKGFGSW
jgi:hypothetical protein